MNEREYSTDDILRLIASGYTISMFQLKFTSWRDQISF